MPDSSLAAAAAANQMSESVGVADRPSNQAELQAVNITQVAVEPVDMDSSTAAVAAANQMSGSADITDRPSNEVKLKALKITPRLVTAEPVNVEECVDLRSVLNTPSATPVRTPLTPLQQVRTHCQVSQTPISASRTHPFIDLNPSPLPSPDCIGACIIDALKSDNGLVCEPV